MRKKILLFLLIGHALSGISQSDTVKYIFMGHTRDDDREHEYVLRTIKNIDYSKFDLTLLGGDLTWNTSADRSTLIATQYFTWVISTPILQLATTILTTWQIYLNSPESPGIMLSAKTI